MECARAIHRLLSVLHDRSIWSTTEPDRFSITSSSWQEERGSSRRENLRDRFTVLNEKRLGHGSSHLKRRKERGKYRAFCFNRSWFVLTFPFAFSWLCLHPRSTIQSLLSKQTSSTAHIHVFCWTMGDFSTRIDRGTRSYIISKGEF